MRRPVAATVMVTAMATARVTSPDGVNAALGAFSTSAAFTAQIIT